MTQAKAVLVAIGVPLVFALLLLTAAPSVAHHKSTHVKGRGHKATGTADAGDNRHPSGKDRSVENGPQGNSPSDPDDDGRGPDRSNGGADKPGGPGGADLADQDGNNGCGNDDDFEDDNEGWCGRNPKRGGKSARVKDARVKAVGVEKKAADDKTESCDDGSSSTDGCSDIVADVDSDCPAGDTMAGSTCKATDAVEETVVLSEQIANDGSHTAAPDDVVLSERVGRPVVAAADVTRDSPLAFTGSSLTTFIFIALLLIDAGVLLLWVKRTT